MVDPAQRRTRTAEIPRWVRGILINSLGPAPPSDLRFTLRRRPGIVQPRFNDHTVASAPACGAHREWCSRCVVEVDACPACKEERSPNVSDSRSSWWPAARSPMLGAGPATDHAGSGRRDRCQPSALATDRSAARRRQHRRTRPCRFALIGPRRSVSCRSA